MASNVDWNYRIVKSGGFLEIHEIYYEDGEAVLCNENAASPCGEDIAELEADMKLYSRAFILPILDMKIFTRQKSRKWLQKRTR
jgi:hypothetical protein